MHPLCLPIRLSCWLPALRTDRLGDPAPPPSNPQGGDRVCSTTNMQRKSVIAFHCFTTPSPPRKRPGPPESCRNSYLRVCIGYLLSSTSIGRFLDSPDVYTSKALSPSPSKE